MIIESCQNHGLWVWQTFFVNSYHGARRAKESDNMKQRFFTILLILIPLKVVAELQLAHTYQDWEHYQSHTEEGGEVVILGVSHSQSDRLSDMVVMRCTTEGVNLLFFNSLPYADLGYQASGMLDDKAPISMDVWVKGTTHWATIPQDSLTHWFNAKQLLINLIGDEQQHEQIKVSLLGFHSMYQALLSSCHTDT